MQGRTYAPSVRWIAVSLAVLALAGCDGDVDRGHVG